MLNLVMAPVLGVLAAAVGAVAWGILAANATEAQRRDRTADGLQAPRVREPC